MDSLPSWVRWITVMAIGLSPILTVFAVCLVGRFLRHRPRPLGGWAAPDQFRAILPRGEVMHRQVDPAFSGYDSAAGGVDYSSKAETHAASAIQATTARLRSQMRLH
jgi:hypothetical protein